MCVRTRKDSLDEAFECSFPSRAVLQAEGRVVEGEKKEAYASMVTTIREPHARNNAQHPLPPRLLLRLNLVASRLFRRCVCVCMCVCVSIATLN